MLYDIANTLLLIGAIQGFIFGGIILSNKKFKAKSNFFLAMLILSLSINNLQYYFWYSGIISRTIFFGFIYIPLDSIIVVFYYLYIQSSISLDQNRRRFNKFLFLPFVTFFSLAALIKIDYFTNILPNGVNIFIGNFQFFHEIFSFGYSLFLLTLGYRLITKHQIISENLAINNLTWLKKLTFILFALCFIWMIALYFDLILQKKNDFLFYSLWILISFSIYIFGHIGIYKYGIQTERKNIRIHQAEHIKPFLSTPSQNKIISEFENYVVMKKAYLNPLLSLELVATELNLSKNYLSQMINSELSLSFSDYINKLRVEEVKEFLHNPEFSHYKMTSLALEAGFNSKTTFNNAFKKFTGMTPSEFKNNNKSLSTVLR